MEQTIVKAGCYDLFSVLGVRMVNASERTALDALERFLCARDGITRSVFFANAHTLNLAFKDPDYRQILNGASAVFPDGTGVRWGARMQNIRLRANLPGTDLIPAFLNALSGRGHTYFMVGATPHGIDCAAHGVRRLFPGWQLVGCHHGYFTQKEEEAVIAAINAASPHLLLVGMGNPLQEQWISRHQGNLKAPLCVAVGGLFDYWGGNHQRAPLAFRRLGVEWTWILMKEPHKWRRYLIGNWQFLARLIYWYYVKKSLTAA